MSGGGGWGLKQGLLSVDPETSYAVPDDDDVEFFIKALEELKNPNRSEGLIVPGSYVLFCVEPHLREEDKLSQRTSPTISLGVAPNTDEGVVLRDEKDEIEIINDHFGAASTTGLFLRTIPEASGVGIADESEKATQAFTTKIDVPRACLSIGLA